MSEALHIKYRPVSFEDVIGQDAVVTSLAKMIKRNASQAFLFSGPSGTGKTTLARIAASEMGCLAQDVLEIDAATYTGIDAMRQIQEVIRYKPFGEGQIRAIIMDEAHALSRQSWQSLLKVVEEPPAHVMWIFCTTERLKVPITIVTRCASFTLKPVSDTNLTDLVSRIAKIEGIKLKDDIRGLVVKEAGGSPRQALVNLALCRDLTNRKDAADILRTALMSDPIVELCRFITTGTGSWQKCMAIVSKLENESPEGVRIVMCNYVATALKNSKTEKETCHLLSILDAFGQSYNPAEQLAPLFLSIGRILFKE